MRARDGTACINGSFPAAPSVKKMKTQADVVARIVGGFWSSFRQIARTQGIPYQWKALNDELPNANKSHCIKNFRIAAGKEQGEFYGCVFQDSDVAKWLEAVSYSLTWQPDAELEALADSAIEDIVAAQQPDGYLNTYYILHPNEERFSNLMDHHELYCAGHLLEAAVAYAQATGKQKLLDAMIRYVDCIGNAIGIESGKLHGYPGHSELEMALMRLYEFTADQKYLGMAKYMIDQRGQLPLYFEEECRLHGRRCGWTNGVHGYQYYQAGMPLREQQNADGHAVRALYLYSGMADVARETQDQGLWQACKTLWNSVVQRRMYITGGVGSTAYGEAFTFDYDLPNDTCYTETCASIALVFLAKRMFRMDPKSVYMDVMEQALYNGVISGMQLDGKRFFYTNPLEVLPEACRRDQNKTHIKSQRVEWFDCACCPPNLIRLLMSMHEYLCSVRENELFIHLYVDSKYQVKLGNNRAQWSCRTKYPWEGKIVFISQCDAVTPYTLSLRIPAWCKHYHLYINNEKIELPCIDGYIHVHRLWREGDQVVLQLDMEVRLCSAHPSVREDAGKVAVMRGPLVYCLEETDNGPDLHLIRLGNIRPEDFQLDFTQELGGMVTLSLLALRESTAQWPVQHLYADNVELPLEPTSLRWIPYFAWGNRQEGEMRVWIRR